VRTSALEQDNLHWRAPSGAARPDTAAPGLHHAHPDLRLRWMIGDRAEGLEAGSPAAPRLGHDFSQLPIHPPAAGAIQAKPEVNRQGDGHEREADRISERVAHADERERLQPERVRSDDPARTAVPPIVREALSSPGQPLDPGTRSFMEPRFGHDFSRVRVHTGALAEWSAREVMARAYTVGHDVVFGAGRFAPGTQEGRRLIAHELTHVVQQSGTNGESVLQRQPVPPAETEMPAEYAFALDKRRRTDKGYARSLAQRDAARIRKSGRLSPEDREEVNAKLRFFEGEAWVVYEELIKPALVEVSQEEIEMPPDPARPIVPPEPGAELARFTAQPTYIDNNIKMVSFFTAELAIIHYHDGSKLELGLVPRWMKPPVEEVDYHTPRENLRLRHDAKEGISFIRESDLRNVPRSMSWAEVQKRYARPVGFYAQPGTGRIVPTRVNMLTAPNLCRVLLDSEKQFVAQTQWVAEWGSQVALAVPTPGGFVGRSVKPGAAEVTKEAARRASRQAATRAVKELTEQLDDLLKAGGVKDITVAGVKFEGVQLSKQGSRLAVRRFRIERVNAPPGQGSLVSEAFEDAAATVARTNGLKSVTINVGVIINPGWREWLEGLGYVFVQTEGAWIKTIKL
jgi:hypothetical protein